MSVQSASVPIAAGLMHLGASPGAALAFLIAGPATNAATITTIWKLLGGRTAVLYLLTIAVSAVGGGLMLDWLIPAVTSGMPYVAEHSHAAMAGSWLSAFWAVLLLAVLILSYALKPSSMANPATKPERTDVGPSPEQLDSGRRRHDVQPLRGRRDRRPSRMPRRDSAVEVDLATGRAVVGGEQLNADELIAAVGAAGYRARAVV